MLAVLAMTWTAASVARFIDTSTFCAVNDCTRGAYEGADISDPLLRASDALATTGTGDAALLLWPPFMLLVIVAVAVQLLIASSLSDRPWTHDRGLLVAGAVCAIGLVLCSPAAPWGDAIGFAQVIME